MSKISHGFVLKNVVKELFESGDRLVEIGTAAFSGTNATVEVTTDLSEVEFALAMPKTVTFNGDDQLSSDGVVTSGAVTFARGSTAPTSDLEFYYILVGRRYD